MDISEPVPLARLLNRYRLAAGLTQEELAERAGVSARGVSDLERGIITKPRAYTVYQLVDALQLSFQDRALFEAAAYQWTILPGDRPCGDHAQPVGSFLGALPPGPLVAREEEMERVRQLLQAASGGAGELLLLAGEQGVGKTRLAQEVAVEAQQRGFLVLIGRSYGTRDANPLGPIWQALSALERHDSWVGNTELVHRWQQILQLAKTSVEVRLFQALGELVTRQAALSPLALLLDDMQRAAPATVQLVDHLVRSTQNAPVFLVVTYREAQLTEANPALAQAVQDLTRERLAVRITLRPFIPEETSTLAAVLMGQEQVSEEFAGFLHRRSKGNPRYVEELVQSLGGRLELEGQIGAGAMGHVFAAYDRKTDRAVAAKLILARGEVSAETLHQFQKEGAMLASLSHPHVVRVYDTFIEEHASCIIMERVEGRSLRQVLDDGPLPLPRAKQLAQQAAAALDHAHQMQIVHCDIKPDNIMVTADDQVKVTDFGIARILKSDITLDTLTTTGMRMGTPLYMAPEQIEGKKVDGRADVYGMGAVLFHMVTGRPPFEGNDPLAIIAKHLQADPPAPSAVDPSIPLDWDTVILKALAKDPARRFQSAASFVGAIADLSGDERPSIAMGDTDRTRRRRLVRMPLLGGAIAVALIAVAGVLGTRGSTSSRSLTPVGQSVPQWGYAGFVSPSLRAPAGIAVDTRGDVYVADTNHDRIVELSTAGLPIAQWGTRGSNPGQLWKPRSVAVDPQGNVYVGDTGNGRIQEFSPQGEFLAQWYLWPLAGGPPLKPMSLAVDGRGNVYFTGAPEPFLTSNLEKLNAGGQQKFELWPAGAHACVSTCPRGPLSDLIGVAVDVHGDVYTLDAAGNTISKFSPAGTLLATLQTELKNPAGLALDPRGDIYVGDVANSRIVKLASTGQLLASWRITGSGSMPFRSPRALAVDVHGNVYVADTGNNRALKLSPAGIVSSEWNNQPSAPVVSLRLSAMTIDTHDNVWAVEKDQGRVYELSPAGKLLLEWEVPRRLGLLARYGLAVDRAGHVSIVAVVGGGELYIETTPVDYTTPFVIAQFSSQGALLSEWGHHGTGPGGLLVPTGLAVDRQSNVYVADTGNSRIQKFSPIGQAIRQWGTFGHGLGQFEWPVGVALDRQGNSWVVDSQSNRVEELSPSGKPLSMWGKTGSGPGEFRGPQGIAVDARGDVYVADTGNNRIQKLSPDGHALAESGTKGFDPGEFLVPTNVSVDSQGNVYVLDWHGVHKLAPPR